MRQAGLAEAAAVVAGALVLTAALTYPLVPKMDRVGRVNTADGAFGLWNVAWVADALIVHPTKLYNANIFYPNTNTLAYSEANIGAGVLALPAWGLTGNPYLAHNTVVIFAFVAAAAGAFYLVRYLSGSWEAGAVAGVLYAFCPFVFARTAHIQLMMTFGLPWSLLAFHRLVDRPTAARAVGLGLALFAQALLCAYYGIFAALMMGLATMYFALWQRRWRSPRYWLTIALAAVIAVGLTTPFFLPYLEVQGRGFGRTIEDAQMYSANWGAWLASSSWAHRWWLSALGDFSEVLFPGLLATAVGIAGAWRGLRGTSTARQPGLGRDVTGYYVLVAGLAFWASLGPDAGLYQWLFDTVPVFAFLRAPARIGLLVVLALTVLSSAVLAPWLRRAPGGRAWTAALVVLAAAELNSAPLTALRDAPPVPEAYRAMARLPRGPVAEFPYFYRRTDFPRHAEYMLGSTVHWMPLINGYSDFIPGEWRETVVPLSSFPTQQSFGILGKIGARYVVFHLQGYDVRSRERLIERLVTYSPFLRPLVQQDDVWLYEIIGWPN